MMCCLIRNGATDPERHLQARIQKSHKLALCRPTDGVMRCKLPFIPLSRLKAPLSSADRRAPSGLQATNAFTNAESAPERPAGELMSAGC